MYDTFVQLLSKALFQEKMLSLQNHFSQFKNVLGIDFSVIVTQNLRY